MDSMKVIHWEHNKAAMGKMSERTNLQLSLGPTRSIENNSLTGFFCRWRCRLFSDKGQVVGFLGEQSFKIDCKLLTPKVLDDFIAQSFTCFEGIMSDKLYDVDLEADLSFQLTDKQVSDFLTEINRIC